LIAVDVEITPEPSDAEQRAILEALRLDADDADEAGPWRRAALIGAAADAWGGGSSASAPA
jgi:hypothetical protein